MGQQLGVVVQVMRERGQELPGGIWLWVRLVIKRVNGVLQRCDDDDGNSTM